MGLFEKDYLLRLLEQITKMIAAVAALITGGRAREALVEIEKARGALAGPLAKSLERVDGASVVALLGDEKARLYATLARQEADALSALSEEDGARRATARAAEIERSLPAR
jgi:hypothetical protein